MGQSLFLGLSVPPLPNPFFYGRQEISFVHKLLEAQLIGALISLGGGITNKYGEGSFLVTQTTGLNISVAAGAANLLVTNGACYVERSTPLELAVPASGVYYVHVLMEVSENNDSRTSRLPLLVVTASAVEANGMAVARVTTSGSAVTLIEDIRPMNPPLRLRGAWNNAATYRYGDTVASDGRIWMARRTNTNVTPIAGADWALLLDKGATGPAGAASTVPGPQGPAGVGVPTGGATGQILRKVSNTNYDTEWASASGHTHAIADVTNLQTSLDAKADLVSGKIPTAQLPAVTIGEAFTVSSQAAMLALAAQNGDIAIRTDQSNRKYLLTGTASTLSSWVEIGVADIVQSVNGQTGVVALAKGDVGLGNVTNEAQIPKTLIDAKGDLLVGTANDTIARLGVGTNGQVLAADSAESSGLKWVTASGPALLQKDVAGNGNITLSAAEWSNRDIELTGVRTGSLILTAPRHGLVSFKNSSTGSSPLGSSYLVSGAGTTEWNGTYTYAGTYNGTSYFSKDGTHYLVYEAGSWYLSSTASSPGSGAPYYVNGGSTTNLPTSGWQTNTGSAPAPTLTSSGGTYQTLVKGSAGDAGIALNQGETKLIYSDGTNCRAL